MAHLDGIIQSAKRHRILWLLNGLDWMAIDEQGITLLPSIAKNLALKDENVIIELLEMVLDHGVDPNIRDPFKRTALFAAVARQMRGVVDLLIDRGARTDVTDRHGDSIAHHFCQHQTPRCKLGFYENRSTITEQHELENVSFVEFMILRGFNFDDHKNDEGKTAFHLAAINPYLQHIVLYLLEHTNHIDFTSEQNRNFLHLLVAIVPLDGVKRELKSYSSRRAKIVELLLERGVLIDTVDESGHTALHTAISSKEEMSIVEMIGDRLLQACQDSAFASRLFLELVGTCAWWDNYHDEKKYFFKVLSALKAKGADVNAKDEYGFSPIHHAAEYKEVSCPLIEFLLGKGCDVNAKNDRGNTALHFVSGHPSSVEVVCLLIKSGAVVNCKNNDMETPLHLAVRNDESIAVVRLLVESGANVNSRDAVGRTALSYASSGSKEKLDVVKMLLQRKAYVNARDQDGKTALIWALMSSQSSAVVEELLKYGANFNEDSVTQQLYFVMGDIAVILKQHWVKLKVAQLPCSDKFDAVTSYDEYQESYSKCLEEIEKLKTDFIADGTSLYNYIHTDVKGRRIFMNNDKLQELVASPALEEKFPRYSALILASYWELEVEKSLLDRAKEAWLALTNIQLDDICIERILYYLNAAELIFMADRDESNG